MQTNNLTLSPTIDRPFELAKTSAKMTISEVFAERKGSYLNEFTLFVAQFNSIPNFIHDVDIDCKKPPTGLLKITNQKSKTSIMTNGISTEAKKPKLMIFSISSMMI